MPLASAAGEQGSALIMCYKLSGIKDSQGLILSQRRKTLRKNQKDLYFTV